MASVNKVILLGSLGRDPEMRYMPNGEAVTNFSMATSDNWKDKSGVKQERVEWHNVVAYRKLAEIMGEYLKKGSSVYIEGRLQTRKWEKDGVTRYTTEIIADSMQMLGVKADNDLDATEEAKKLINELSDEEKSLLSDALNKKKSTSSKASNFDDFDSDIPF